MSVTSPLPLSLLILNAMFCYVPWFFDEFLILSIKKIPSITSSFAVSFNLLTLSNVVRCITTSSKVSCHAIVVHRDTADNNPNVPFEFTDANMKRLEAIINNYPAGCQRSALCAAMDIAQRQIGWLPISAMHKIAELLSIPRMRVYEWATFYTMVKREYRGKYSVRVCVTTPCMLRGSDTILEAAKEATCCDVGGVAPDGVFSLETVQCQGACANAPLLVIDDDYYEDVTVDNVVKIINTIRSGCIPPAGPQSGRYAAEPITGQTTLCGTPSGPGHLMQAALLKQGDPSPKSDGCPPKSDNPPLKPSC